MAMRIDKSNNEATKAAWMLALLLSFGGMREANAVLITGTRIPLTATTFALPVEITDAIELSEWTFDLTYDPTDVLINTACDPFSGDAYCSLLTSPIDVGPGGTTSMPDPGLLTLLATALLMLGAAPWLVPSFLSQSGRVIGFSLTPAQESALAIRATPASEAASPC